MSLYDLKTLFESQLSGMNCQTFSTGFSSGAPLNALGWQRQQGDVVGDVQFRGHVPPGLVDDHHRMSAGVDGCTDLGEMRLHGVSIAPQSLQGGMTRPAPLPLAGQIAPKM